MEPDVPRRYDDLIMVNSQMSVGEFKVRVLKKWIVSDVLKTGKVLSVDMILMDKNGHKIQASIPDDLRPLFDHKIVEGSIYVISNFSVGYNAGQFLASYHRNVLIFNVNTDVKFSWDYGMPSHGVSLIGADNVLRLPEKFNYLVDVIGVITYIRHYKNFPIEGGMNQTVNFKLTDNRATYECELAGKFVDVFRQMMKKITLGLPVVVLQFARVVKDQGRNIVKSVDGVSKLYVNPEFYEAKKFRKGLVLALNRTRMTLGVHEGDKTTGFHFNSEYKCKSILQLREDPELGKFVINARLADIVALDSWWYPVCKCDIIIESYLGAFFCDKCYTTEFQPVQKYRVNMVIEDETGATRLESFDHVLLPIAVVAPKNKGIRKNFFPRAFDSVIGKSIMFIVEKKKHNADFLQAKFELLCVSDSAEVKEHYFNKGLCSTPSKVIPKLGDEQCMWMRPVIYKSPVTTTNKLLAEYLNPAAAMSGNWVVGESSNAGGSFGNWEVGESSNAGGITSIYPDCNTRSVRARYC